MTDALRAQLETLAENLHWAWAPGAESIFQDLAPALWESSGHDPHAILRSLDDDALTTAAATLRGRIDRACRALRLYLEDHSTWSHRRASLLQRGPIAYFCAEFGLHESLAIYSGGLGVLSGDHLKSASDLGLSLVGVGLFYKHGYFRQSLDADGMQREEYPHVEPSDKGFTRACDASGEPIKVVVPTADSTIAAAVWEMQVGRRRLLMLDTDIEDNSEADRRLTTHLYGGDQRIRIRQELVLGVGGMRALRALGIKPGVLHLNEGHSAFAALEATALRMEREGLSIEDATHEVACSTVFTTHTPVPAGHDRFEAGLLLEHLRPLGERLGVDDHGLLSFGREQPDNHDEAFCMTVLALKMSQYVNGVSYLHGRVSRKMWAGLWPERSRHEVPIGHITNGIHVPTFLAPRMWQLLDDALGLEWSQRLNDSEIWNRVERIDSRILWEVRQELKASMIRYVRRRASDEAKRRGEPASVVDALQEALDEDVLLIGFARRFATYKRAGLLLRDLDALDELVNGERRLSIVFAGKAHPRDEGGKRLIQSVFKVTRDPRFIGKVLFLENYDLGVGKAMTQGVDLWLNNPRRPLEASGTSGQKVVYNGGLNCSVLDGWWAEAYDGSNGFAIGTGEVHRDVQVQDERDHEALLATMRDEVLPLYYDREQGLPQGWIARVKRSMTTLGWRFNSDRMVLDYARNAYLPAAGIQLSERR